jgi:hypothetical protein
LFRDTAFGPEHYDEVTNSILDPLLANLIEEAYLDAKRLVSQRIKIIDEVTDLLLAEPKEMVPGEVLMECLRNEFLAEVNPGLEALVIKKRDSRMGIGRKLKAKYVNGVGAGAALATFHLLSSRTTASSFLKELNVLLNSSLGDMTEETTSGILSSRDRLKKAHEFATSENAPFPPAPLIPPYCGFELIEWLGKTEPFGLEAVVRRSSK